MSDGGDGIDECGGFVAAERAQEDDAFGERLDGRIGFFGPE